MGELHNNNRVRIKMIIRIIKIRLIIRIRIIIRRRTAAAAPRWPSVSRCRAALYVGLVGAG